MIQINNLHLQFGEQVVFDSISCTIEKSDKIGLVGRNGAGKSTLLKVIADHMQADSGTISFPKSAHIAYMPQEVVITSNKNILDETLTTFGNLYKLAQEKEKLAQQIINNPSEEHMYRYAELEHELLEHNFEAKRVEAQKILAGLGFDKQKQQLNVNELSVGWRMRVVLAKLLLQKADFYLFDEPTNHLDLPTKNWFLDFLKNSSFGYLLVCHDRYFLDKACHKIFEIARGNLNIFHGNYTYYKKQSELQKEQLEQAYKKQQQEIKQKERTIERFRSKSSKAKMAQSMIKSLEKINRIELIEDLKNINIKLHTPTKSGKIVLTVQNVTHAFDKELFKNVSFEIERGDKVALVAPNGTGKTTLFNLIANKLPLQQGSIELGHNVSTSLFDQDQEKVLDPGKTILEEVSDHVDATEQQIRSILGAFLFSQDDICKKTSVLSGGERNRVAMTKVILSKANFLLLDEPTNHLDLESKEIILQALQKFEGTILFVSHDQDFVNKLATKTLILNSQGIELHLGNYESYLSAQEFKQKHDNNIIENNNPIKTIPSNSKDLFDLQKKCKNLENKISKQEEILQKLLIKLGTVEFDSNEYKQAEQEYQKLQERITLDTEQWEDLLTQIDKELS